MSVLIVNKKVCGKMKSKFIVATLVLLAILGIFSYPVMAGGFDTGTGMVPSFSQAWGGLDQYIKDKIMWIVGLSLVGLVAVGIVYSAISGGGALLSSHRGDVAGRSSNISNMFLGVAVIFIAMIAISLITYLVM